MACKNYEAHRDFALDRLKRVAEELEMAQRTLVTMFGRPQDTETVGFGPTGAESRTIPTEPSDARAQVDTTPPEPTSSPSPGPEAPSLAGHDFRCAPAIHFKAREWGAKFCPDCGAFLGS